MIGERLRIARKAKKYTQEELAKIVNTKKTTISNYETGYSSPSPEMINDLADILDVSTDFLYGRTDNPKGFSRPDMVFTDKNGKTFIVDVKGSKHETNQYKINQRGEVYDSLTEINKIIKELGIEDIGFFDIEKWKNLRPEDVDEIRRHFEWVAQKAKARNEEK